MPSWSSNCHADMPFECVDIICAAQNHGRPLNDPLDEAKLAAIEAALLARYADFGATLASETGEIEGVRVSKETVRQIQIGLGCGGPGGGAPRRSSRFANADRALANSSRSTGARQHPLPRAQIAHPYVIASEPLPWFQGRGPRCTLIVFIDDATGRLTRLQFASRATKAYLQALEAHVLTHGVPLAFYSDRHGFSASTCQRQKRRRAATA